MLAPTLDGPELVFPPGSEHKVELARERLRLARARYFAMRRNTWRDAHSKRAFLRAIDQLTFAWRVLVMRSVGYTYVGAELDGARVLFAFDVPELRA